MNIPGSVPVVVEMGDEIGADPTARWAVEHLTDVLSGLGITVSPATADNALRISLMLGGSGCPGTPESFTVSRPQPQTISIAGSDARGLAYAVLDLADVAALAADPLDALAATEPTSGVPATPIRSISRLFSCDVEDKPWFHDRGFWDGYLTELATHRINRLQLGFGMQYNYSHDPDIRDNYLCFAYPFLVEVPAYDVRAGGVSDDERARNLETLRWVSAEAKRRGIHFQLGLWNHAFEMPDSPNERYPITGLSAVNHATYCSAALEALLRACPAIDGLTLRVHYEGGVPEPGHAFWRTVLSAVSRVGRPLEIDMHAKGVDAELVDIARGTGASTVISAKYWAEHLGLPYHQVSVRSLEEARDEPGTGLRAITQNKRRFTRYGYGDFLREDRDFGVLFRIWPGTQRVLLWGDPVLAAGYGRLCTIGGALGAELCEPLSFKGRKTSGEPGGRDPYADPDLRLPGDPWIKYRYTYRLWGRLLYDPDADPASWRRFLRHEYGPAAADVEAALGAASRILPLVTVAHGPSAANNFYWPEMYLNMPLAGGTGESLYRFDTPAPGTFGAVSPFDPGLFDRIDDHADDLVAGRRSGRYPPSEVATWLERLADDAERAMARAVAATSDPAAPTFRRTAVDVTAQAGLGRFFANKLRAGLSYSLHQRTKDVQHLAAAVATYRAARDAFAAVADATTGVYRAELAFGRRTVTEHGHWADRLIGIEEDLAALEAEHEAAAVAAPADLEPTAVPEIPRVERPELVHIPPAAFRRGGDVVLNAALADPFDGTIELRYRHLNQGEHYRTTQMDRQGGACTATVPGTYTDSPYPLVYYFTIRHADGDAWIVPGLDETLANQPYHVVQHERT